MKIYVSHSSSYDYVNELYNPIEQSNLIKKHNFFLPHKKENLPMKPNNNISNFDIVLAEVSFPSTGQGIELGWAQCLNKPIICIYKKNSKISSALKVTANIFIEYSTKSEMIKKIEDALNNI